MERKKTIDELNREMEIKEEAVRLIVDKVIDTFKPLLEQQVRNLLFPTNIISPIHITGVVGEDKPTTLGI